DDPELRKTVYEIRALRVEVVARVVSTNLRPVLETELGPVDGLDRRNPRAPLLERAPEFGRAPSQRRDRANTSDRNPAHAAYWPCALAADASSTSLRTPSTISGMLRICFACSSGLVMSNSFPSAN